MKKLLILIIIVAIIAGLIVIFTSGFNFDILTKEHQQIKLSIGEEYKSDELKKIIEDAIGQNVEVQKNGDFEDQAIISAKQIPSEKMGELVTKVNEKYGTEITEDDIKIKDIPGNKLIDLISPYIVSIVVSIIVILVYFAIKYKAEGIVKVILKTIGSVAIAEIFTFSIIALVRIPVGYNIASIILTIYALTIFATTLCFDKKLQEIKLKENSKEKSN